MKEAWKRLTGLVTVMTLLLAVALCFSACGGGETGDTTAPETTEGQSAADVTKTEPTDHEETDDDVSTQVCQVNVMNSAMKGEAELSVAEDGTFTLIGGYDIQIAAETLADMGLTAQTVTYRFETKITGTWEETENGCLCTSGAYFGRIVIDDAQAPTLEAFMKATTADDQAQLDATLEMIRSGEYKSYDDINGHYYDLDMELESTEDGFRVVRTREYEEDGRLFVTYDHVDGEVYSATYLYAFGGVHYIHYYVDGQIHHTDYYDVDGNYTDTSYPDEDGDY